MSSKPPDVRELVAQARDAVRDAVARSDLARAWEALQERDADGNAKGPLPYTDEALAEFEAAHERNPDDPNIVHHLAIVHHARAWDLELMGDARAAAAWNEALKHWRILRSSGEFWAGLERKLLACDPKADASFLADVRSNLYEHLLDVHVDFIRQYCEQEAPGSARTHLEIIKAARIPPVVKNRLIEKVFEAMTASIPEARANRAYDSAMRTVELFLELFPDALPALRLHAELCRDWIGGMSYQDDWDEIRAVADRAHPFAGRLSNHPDLDADPMARTALVELSGELCLRGRDRGQSFLSDKEAEAIGERDRRQAELAFEFGIAWGRLGIAHGTAESLVQKILPVALNGRAICLDHEASNVFRSETLNGRDKIRTGVGLFRNAVALLEEACGHAPDQDVLRSNLEGTRKAMEDLEAQERQLDLLGGLGGMP